MACVKFMQHLRLRGNDVRKIGAASGEKYQSATKDRALALKLRSDLNHFTYLHESIIKCEREIR